MKFFCQLATYLNDILVSLLLTLNILLVLVVVHTRDCELLKLFVVLRAFWYHMYDLKNVNFIKSNISPWVLSRFRLRKW